MSNRPGPIRSVAVASIATAATWWLLRLTPATGWPRSADPTSILSWWHTTGTPAVTIAIVRAAGIAVGAYTTAVSIAGALLGTTRLVDRSTTAAAVWSAVSTDTMRRLLAVGSVAIWSVNPMVASAAIDDPPPIVLTDLGPAPTAAETVEVLTSMIEESPVFPDTIPESEPSAPTRTWTVVPGDHMWHIAEKTLERSGRIPSLESTAKYWRQLIAANQTTVGADPNLIYPGQILVLPAP